MYIVPMKRFTASDARRELFRILDSVEKGEVIVLERKGVRFRLILDRDESRPEEGTRKRLMIRDPAVLSGEWTWTADDDGQLQFHSREC